MLVAAVYVIKRVVAFLLTLIELAMFVRAILSWVAPDSDGPVSTFCEAVTEPLIQPVRSLLDRFAFVQNLPFDISFLVTYILLSVVQSLLW